MNKDFQNCFSVDRINQIKSDIDHRYNPYKEKTYDELENHEAVEMSRIQAYYYYVDHATEYGLDISDCHEYWNTDPEVVSVLIDDGNYLRSISNLKKR